MKSKNKYGVIVFLITVLMISSGFGSMIVAERSDEIRFAYQSSHPYTYYALPLRSKYYAQKFYVPENVDFLTKFKIFCGDHANEGGFYEAGIKIDLYGGSIHAESGPLSSLGSLGWHEFYPADISVTPGSYYYLYFQVWTSVGVGSIGAGGNNYPNGELWEYDGSWSAISNRDMAFEVWGYTIPPRTITFYTNPTDGGTITFDGSTYSHGESVQKPDGQYPVIANPENNYDFDRWTTTGGINVANQYAQSTTATVTDDGTITAHFDYNPPNSPPETPSTPSGPSSGWHGTSYQYSTSTTDPNNDDVYYKWDWGDETSGWIGPYDSGEKCYASHTWD